MRQNKNYMQTMTNTSLLSGGNNLFVESLYEDYLRDDSSVPQNGVLFRQACRPQACGMMCRTVRSARISGIGPTSGRCTGAPDEARKQAAVLQLNQCAPFSGCARCRSRPVGIVPHAGSGGIESVLLRTGRRGYGYQLSSPVRWRGNAHDPARDLCSV